MFLRESINSVKQFINHIASRIKVLFIIYSNDAKVISPKFLEFNNDAVRPAYSYPKVIWLYWHSIDEVPTIVNLCVERIRSYCPEFEVNFLNESTVKDFITVPDISEELPVAIKADYIRLKLLDTYGGIWMDSSILLNDNIEWIFERINNHDAFVFFSDECTEDINFPITENWFIVAPLGSLFIRAWLREFSLCIFSNSPTEFYNDIKYNKSFVQNLTRPDYLLCYISAIKVLRENYFKVLYASSSSVGHYFNYKYKFNGLYVATVLTKKNESDIPKLKLIKLTSQVRNVVENTLSSGKIKKGSYIYNVIKSNHSGTQ